MPPGGRTAPAGRRPATPLPGHGGPGNLVRSVRRNFGETAVLPDRRAIFATTVLAVAALIILLVLLS